MAQYSWTSSCLLVLVVLASKRYSNHSSCMALSSPKTPGANQKFPQHMIPLTSRRSLLSLMIPAAVILKPADPSTAVTPKNELLCGTGLFENFQEYRCTSLGDISDEGKVKEIDSQEKGAMDSLLSKMGVEDSVDQEDERKSGKDRKQKNKDPGAVAQSKQ